MNQKVKEKNFINFNNNIFNSEVQRVKTKEIDQEIELAKPRKKKYEGKIEEKPKLEKNKSQNNNHSVNKCFLLLSFLKQHKKIFIPMAIIIVLIILIIVVLLFIFKNKNGKDNLSQNETIMVIPTEPDFKEYKIKKEFDILTKTGDLRRISVTQISKEETKMNSEIILSKIIRKTNYDIYFKSEEEATEENKKYYSKMHKGIVSIRSECTTAEGEDCQPQPLVDLTSKTRSISLTNSEEFRDIPIALCMFNITDNHIITTMTCPDSLPDNKRNEIILDLYFFRPPAAERVDKEGDKITLTIKQEDKLTKIHKTNGGFCNIYNNLNSLCTTDMNTTLDQEGNLLFYEEEANTIIN